MNEPTPKKEVHRVVMMVVMIAALFVAGIAVSFFLAVQVSHHQQTAEAALAQREATSQLRASTPVCKALIEMDQARIGAVNASSSPQSYGHKLARAIHDVVKTTSCYTLIDGLKAHKSYTTILHEIEAKQHGTR